MRKFSTDELKMFKELAGDPVEFSKAFFKNPSDGSPFVPSRIQERYLRSDAEAVWCCFHRRAGKALPLNSRVYTPEGYKEIKDIELGDEVVTPDGQAKVVEIYDFESKPLIRLTFDDGTYIDSCSEHLWEVYTPIGYEGKRRKYSNVVLTSEEILKNLTYNYSNRSEFNFKLNPIKPAQHTKKKLALDPYVMGVFIGDGSLNTGELTSADNEIPELVESKVGAPSRIRETNTKAKRYFYKQLIPVFKDLGMNGLKSRTKSIPDEYLLSDVEDRTALLRGLMDTDGSIDKRRSGQAEYCTVSPILAEQVAELARSLGCKVTIRSSKAQYTKNNQRITTGIRYRLHIRYPEEIEIFTLDRKKRVGMKKKHLRRTIIRAEYIGSQPVRCIGIDSEEHLFLTNHYIPTHNCLEGSVRVVDPVSLRPTPIARLSGIDETQVFDFKANDVVWSKAKWHKNSERKLCLKLELETGVELILSEDHEVFTRDQGWVKAKDIGAGTKLLAPTHLPIEGDTEGTDEEIQKLIGSNETKLEDIPDVVFKLTNRALARYFYALWSRFGRVFRESEYIRLSTNNKALATDLHHLLLRLSVSARIDETGSILITDDIDITRFLNQIGMDIPILDVRAPRRWEVVLGIKSFGYRDVYDIEVDHHDHNFIANDVVVHNSYGLSSRCIYNAVTEPNQRILIFCPSETQRKEIFTNIDGFVRTSPLINALKHKPWSNSNPYLRGFRNNSVIEGHILGVGDNSVTRESRRGLTADYAFLDEAQDFTDETWRVLLPIIRGNLYRPCKQAYIFGTIVKPQGHYFDMIFKPEMKTANDEIMRIPIHENPDFAERPEKIEELMRGTPEMIWKTEYLLLPSSLDTSVFRMEHVDQAFAKDYSYGTDLIRQGHIRVMGVDWDKVQAGTTILIGQYDPINKDVKMIYREEVPPGQFTLSIAVDRIFELYKEFAVDIVTADTGFAGMQIEQLILKSIDLELDLHTKLIPITMQSKVESPDFQNPDNTIRSYMKDFIVELTRRKFEEGLIHFPTSDQKAKDQFYLYEVVRETESRRVYSKEDEHIIDATAFILYGIFKAMDNFLGASFGETAGVRMINTAPTYREIEHAEKDAWSTYDDREYKPYRGSYWPSEEY